MKSLHKTPIKNPIVFKIISFISNIPLCNTYCIASIIKMYNKNHINSTKLLTLTLNLANNPKGKYKSVFVTTRSNVKLKYSLKSVIILNGFKLIPLKLDIVLKNDKPIVILKYIVTRILTCILLTFLFIIEIENT